MWDRRRDTSRNGCNRGKAYWFGSPSTCRPGFSLPSGSKACFILFIKLYSASFSPKLGRSRRISKGALSITARYLSRTRQMSAAVQTSARTMPFNACAIQAGGRYSFIISCAEDGSPTILNTIGARRSYLDRSLSQAALSSLPSKIRSEEHTSELQSHSDLVCRLLLEKKKKTDYIHIV